MQGSQEREHAKLWGPRAHFGANIEIRTLCHLAVPLKKVSPLDFQQFTFQVLRDVFIHKYASSRMKRKSCY